MNSYLYSLVFVFTRICIHSYLPVSMDCAVSANDTHTLLSQRLGRQCYYTECVYTLFMSTSCELLCALCVGCRRVSLSHRDRERGQHLG